uniref:Uncharacterized protein n=1 Tax=Meloidogyne enterolobii TaxID=390850 RepID=A0A6V7XAW7_MELEN|nr:unnamed protein product [Meloidogyne enterolobii]
MSLPKMPRTKRHFPKCPGQNVTSQNARTKRHFPKCPGQNVTPQNAPDKTSLPISSTLKMTRTENPALN